MQSVLKLFGQIVACNQNCLQDRGQQLFATCAPCHPSNCNNLESLPLCIPRDHLEETSWDISSSRNLNSSHLPTMKGCQLFRVRALPIVWYLGNMRTKHCRLAVRSCLRKKKLGVSACQTRQAETCCQTQPNEAQQKLKTALLSGRSTIGPAGAGQAIMEFSTRNAEKSASK